MSKTPEQSPGDVSTRAEVDAQHSHRTMRIIATTIGIALLPIIVASFAAWFIKVRNPPALNPCEQNLLMIDVGKEQVAFARSWSTGVDCDNATNKVVVNTYIKGNTTPRCPDGGVYRYNPIGKKPECSKSKEENIKTRHKLPE
jgi:hypothetical protein